MTTNSDTTQSSQDPLDIIVIGAGFAGLYHLHELRKLGYAIRLFEAGRDIGGVWYWNAYPGARCDSESDVYQFSWPEVWKDWSFTEKFPSRDEMMDYFHHVDRKLDLSRDISFNSRVLSARFDGMMNRWDVEVEHEGSVRSRYNAQFLIVCTGFTHQPRYPNIKGLHTFRGPVIHTARWVEQGGRVELEGKRVGVIGTGSSGVQVIQSTSRMASHVTVFQRNFKIAFPMMQKQFTLEEREKLKEAYPAIFETRERTCYGLAYDFPGRRICDPDMTPEEIESRFEEQWTSGGRRMYCAFEDVWTDTRANDVLYEFWRKKIMTRIHDPTLCEALAPQHPSSRPGERNYPCLEQGYYEVFNQENVTLVDLRANPIIEVTSEGIKTSDGKEHQLDVLILATGFHTSVGGMKSIDLYGTDGVTIRERWDSEGIQSYLGLMCAKYPNMFIPYGPLGPNGVANGPSCIELQGRWIASCLQHVRTCKLQVVEPVEDKQRWWKEVVQQEYASRISGQANKTNSGAVVETAAYLGGLGKYRDICEENIRRSYQGLSFST